MVVVYNTIISPVFFTFTQYSGFTDFLTRKVTINFV